MAKNIEIKNVNAFWGWLRRLLQGMPAVMIAALICGGAVWAGSLTPSASPSASGYTLEDIYNRINTNAIATTGNHSFSPLASPAGSMRTLTEIYDKIPTIDAAKILAGTTYLGVAGTIAIEDSVVGTNGELAINLPDGYYSGKTATAADSNLTAGNIKSGVSVFGVSGSLLPGGGTATAANVLSGATFFGASQSDWNLQTGTMANIGAQTITPSTTNQAITAGYHNGSGYCAGDSDLISANIKSGTNLFGVDGNSNVVDTSSGDAAAGDILSGKKAWVDGAEIIGSVAAGDNVSGGNGSLTFNIPDGLYSGTKTCKAADSNLTAGNIKSGTTIFGVAGSLASGRSVLPDTGQTASYTATYGEDHDYTSANAAVCDRAASGSDASFTNNHDGTIIDNCTNLMWKACGEGQTYGDGTPPTCSGSASTMDWEAALLQCEGLNFAGYDDWRLPNINELLSIANYSTYSPSINTYYFPSTVSNWYWTSSTDASYTTNKWTVGFYSASSYSYGKTNSARVRCVRGQ